MIADRMSVFSEPPDVGWSIPRAVTGALARTGGASLSPILLIAPSGYGKTVACAQLAASRDNTQWVDCGSGDVDLASVRAAAEWRPSGVDRHDGRSCLVLDGLALSAMDGEGWRLLAAIVSDAKANDGLLVISASDMSAAAAAHFRGFRFVNAKELLLTGEEAGSLLESVAPESGLSALRLHAATGGHVGFFVALAQSCREHIEVFESSAYAAWFEHLYTQLAQAEQQLLVAVALLGTATPAELQRIGLAAGHPRLERVREIMPLLRAETASRSVAMLSVDGALLGYLLEHIDHVRDALGSDLARVIVELLVERGETGRAARIVGALGDHEITVDYLRSSSDALLADRCWNELEELLSGLPMSVALADHHTLLVWAALEEDRECDEEAYDRAASAYRLTAESGDEVAQVHAGLILLHTCVRLGRWDEAGVHAARLQDAAHSGKTAAELTSRIWTSLACMRMETGALDESARNLGLARASLTDASRPDDFAGIAMLEALQAAVTTGDHLAAARTLAPLMNNTRLREGRRLAIAGILGALFMEAGRLERAIPLLELAVESNRRWIVARHLPALACAALAAGDDGRCKQLFDDAFTHAVKRDQEALPTMRVHEAIALRARGEVEEALGCAERAYEMLLSTNHMSARASAALEVAGSLLALGDTADARRWVERTLAEEPTLQPHHALRGALVLAECDRRQGGMSDAVARLAAVSDQILSGNSNWLIAMYVRAFPELLSTLSLAVGADRLPSHLLKMLPSHHAQAAASVAREILDEQRWGALGQRLLGEQTFERFAQNGKVEVCRVRMFGGLEIRVADRVITDKGWRKRKSRQLFAMLALRRGSDTPREELFDRLWPELEHDRAKNNFYVAWSSIKSALMGSADRYANCPYIESVGGRCRIVPDYVRTDLDEFDEELRNAKSAEVAGKYTAALKAYERAAALYRGDLLPADVYDDWFNPYRSQYRVQYIEAMARAADVALRLDQPGEALTYVRKGLSVDPLREDLYQIALRSHIFAGQRSAAVDIYFQCRNKLGEELGLDPSGETMKLYQEVLSMEDAHQFYRTG